VDIIKASGEKEKFQEEKLYRSLKNSGIQPALAGKVMKEVKKKIYSGIPSAKIHGYTACYLNRENPAFAARYNLKRAIMDLGPTGYPFEKYVAEIFNAYGYRTRVGQVVRGNCVSHEVDVVAEKENRHFMVECKYHNGGGIRSDVKVALYVYARFLDIKKVWEKFPRHKNFFHQAWLVTNTKCTSQAIRYAKCVGLKIISWHYPKNESLEYIIEKKALYPITTLPNLSWRVKESLVANNIVLVEDLARRPIGEIIKLTGFKEPLAQKLQSQARNLCV